MLNTTLTRLLGIEHPIIQAGMAAEAGPDLAVAVSDAGGLGTLGTIASTPDRVEAAIARTRDLTGRPFSVNLVTFETAPFRDELIDLALRMNVPNVTLSFGDFGPALARFKAAGATVLVQVQDAAQARAALAGGADVVMAQGAEAGGHTGQRGTLSFAAQVIEMADGVPVVVAGGVGNGRGLAAALAMGAAGVVMGTRFKLSHEYAGRADQKAAIAASDGSDTLADLANDAVLPFTWPANVRGRVIRTPFASLWEGRTDELRAKAATYAQPYGILLDATLDPPVNLNWAGESAALMSEELPAGEIVHRTVAEAETLLRSLNSVLH